MGPQILFSGEMGQESLPAGGKFLGGGKRPDSPHLGYTPEGEFWRILTNLIVLMYPY